MWEMYCYDWSFHRLGRLATSRLGSEGDDRESQTFMADLSDLIRPTALTLRLSEIYNNEWLFAYESLMSRVFNEKKVIGELLSCITVRVREQAFFCILAACILPQTRATAFNNQAINSLPCFHNKWWGFGLFKQYLHSWKSLMKFRSRQKAL